jgi:deoxycytidylate deaminase
MTHSHGSIIHCGSKIICKGCNTNKRSSYRKNISCSLHAEVDAIIRFLNSYFRIHTIGKNFHKIRRKLKKYSITVVRHNGHNESKPCLQCIKKIQELGFSSIYYTDSEDSYIRMKIRDIDLSEYHDSGVIRRSDVNIHMVSVFRW